MRWIRVWAAVLAFAPLPAAADVAAHYDLGRRQLSVEVDGNGDYRAEIAGKFMLLRRAGIDYVVIYQGATPLVIERRAFLDLARKMVPPAPPKASTDRQDAVVANGGVETVAGRRGTVWMIRAEKTEGNAILAVMSADRDLAPIGTVFASALDAGLETFGAMLPASNLDARLREVMAKGAPLRLALGEEVRLRSVSSADIDSSRFALPGPVMDASAFDQAMSAPAAPDPRP